MRYGQSARKRAETCGELLAISLIFLMMSISETKWVDSVHESLEDMFICMFVTDNVNLGTATEKQWRHKNWGYDLEYLTPNGDFRRFTREPVDCHSIVHAKCPIVCICQGKYNLCEVESVVITENCWLCDNRSNAINKNQEKCESRRVCPEL